MHRLFSIWPTHGHSVEYSFGKSYHLTGKKKCWKWNPWWWWRVALLLTVKYPRLCRSLFWALEMTSAAAQCVTEGAVSWAETMSWRMWRGTEVRPSVALSSCPIQTLCRVKSGWSLPRQVNESWFLLYLWSPWRQRPPLPALWGIIPYLCVCMYVCVCVLSSVCFVGRNDFMCTNSTLLAQRSVPQWLRELRELWTSFYTGTAVSAHSNFLESRVYATSVYRATGTFGTRTKVFNMQLQ